MNLLSSVFRATAVAFALAQPAFAQVPPTVKLVVGYTAGGPVDASARLLAPGLAKELGTNVIVENRPGASGALAGDLVAKAPADGSLLFFAASPTMTIAPHVQKKMAFDPAKDLVPLAPVLSYANVLVVNKDSPYRTVADLVKDAKANPGKLTFGSAGPGASNHLSGELFALRAGVKLTHVPYKGNAPAMNDVLGGQLTMMFDIIGSARSFVSAGRVRALAVTARERNASLADVPTMEQAGVPGVEVLGWYGVYAPAKMPAALASRYTEAINKTLAADEVRTKLVAQGYDVWTGPAQTLADQQKKEYDMWAVVARGIKIEE